ncbi:precorrin-3B C(17)-methyltransferase [Bacillus marasmi]|uniref:precorrin-3B C(17)-methyltransferase n=1 Tax=Bacillus marasmi TaxID=1926279 RepID=UPI0011CC3D37|nr:precorrin-3B C(17)-methyltransferase [Bacillus marasmi]
MKGKVLVIGFGPGSFQHITDRARAAIRESNMIIGYKTYVDLIEGLLTENQEIVSTGMTEEVSRAQEAVKQAERGNKVAVISSGDAGVYGMAGLIYEVLIEKGWKKESGVEVEIVPGISAINSCASLLGAPVMHDACTISLSDHLTPWQLIESRIDAAAKTDFVIAFYNPKSGRRTKQIEEAQRILLKYRSPETPVGLVKSAYRDREQVVVTNLKEMLNHEIGMLTTVIVGNSSTVLHDGLMITPRGYQRKYTLNQAEQPLKLHQRLTKEAEPWSLEAASAVETPLRRPTPAEGEPSLRDLAEQALQMVSGDNDQTVTLAGVYQPAEAIFELAVSPGVANKKFTAPQLITLAEVVGENGVMEYTQDHQMKLGIPTENPDEIIEKLTQAGLLLAPVGDVLTIKACDFCDGDKKDSIPYAEELQRKLGGIQLPKELKLGINGCGMACYGAVKEDIGIVYRQGAFDLFLGGKTVGRTGHPGQIVAEGIEPDQIVGVIENIIRDYQEYGYPNERFFKFFKRVKQVQGFTHVDITPKLQITAAPCGD